MAFNNVSEAHENRTKAAGTAWNDKQYFRFGETYLYFSEGYYYPELDIYDGSYVWSEWAFTTGTCRDGRFSQDHLNITINDRTIRYLSLAHVRFVMVHELGHTAGLGHNRYENPCGKTVMWGNCARMCDGSMNPPWYDDLDGLKAIND
jgi:predicted SprT family Zn-dependent metalloprotease